MSTKTTNIIAICLLTLMFLLAVFSICNDSLTMDEVAHLPAGYSYLTQKDMRLNPEHPPLLKDLAAFPSLFIKGINFPHEIKDWKEDINGQWGFGYNFLYHRGNPAEKMIFWGRIPMILLLILLGYYVFRWARELFGGKAGLLALFLFAFSPTFLAHGRLITTDVGAAAGAFIATYYFVKALQNPIRKNILLSGISFGIAQLIKFSLFILVPFFVFLAVIWWLFKKGKFWQTIKIIFFTFLIGFLLVWPVYLYHTWNYPIERQVRDTEFLLSSYGFRPLANLVTWLASKPILRPYAQYALGLLMVGQRAAGGHTTYFLGELSATGWRHYFPIVYIIKETLVLHILTIIALFYLAWIIKKPFWVSPFARLKDWLKKHFPEFAMLVFAGIYWLSSIASNLNIGVRHLLPTFPFVFVLVGGVTIKWLSHSPDRSPSPSPFSSPFPPSPVSPKTISRYTFKYLILTALIFWQAISVIKIYPHFLAYFNEIVGGPDKGYIYTVDSNLDWGQDLKRLTSWVNQNKIDKIYVDYFGGSDAKYYLGNKFISWWGTRDPREFVKGNYLAISATFLQGGRGHTAPHSNLTPGYYNWLWQYQPVFKIGYSIFVYYID